MLILAVLACASRTPNFPGPLKPVAAARPPPAHVTDLPSTEHEPLEVEPSDAPARPAAKVAKKTTRTSPAKGNAAKSGVGNAAGEAASYYLEHTPKGFRNDCSGFVMAVYARAGVPISGSSKTLWEDAQGSRSIHHRKRPSIGDIAFFDNTYDRNGNGRRDDALTHVAIVIDIDDNGTITLAHSGTSRGRTTMRMNLQHPELRHGPDGSVYNDWLRARKKGEPQNGKYFSGQLFKGFASVPQS